MFIVSVITLVSTSCLMPVYRGQQPYQTPQFREIGQGSVRQSGTAEPQRQLSSINTTQVRSGHIIADVASNHTVSDRDQVARHATQVYESTGRVPSEQELTRKFGFLCRAKWIDEPDRKVKTVVVRPDEVPASVRAKFQ